METVTRRQASEIRELRKSFDLLTNVLVIQLNKINSLLTELEKT